MRGWEAGLAQALTMKVKDLVSRMFVVIHCLGLRRATTGAATLTNHHTFPNCFPLGKATDLLLALAWAATFSGGRMRAITP